MRASKSPQPGSRIHLPEGVTATVRERCGDASWTVDFSPAEDFTGWLERVGSMPLPPYIKRPAADADRERYQTLFARERGAVAAPTAGLHFTSELIDALQCRGVEVMPLTLHVGLGTFLPVRVDDLREHRMHRERYAIPATTAAAVNARKQGGGRVIALGTTTARALEQAARERERAWFEETITGRAKDREYREAPILGLGGVEHLIAWRHTIMRGESGYSPMPLFGGDVMGSTTIARAMSVARCRL